MNAPCLSYVRMPIRAGQYRMMIDRHFHGACMSRSGIALSMRRNLFSLYEVDVRVNGRAMRFIIDTGAQISGIRAHAARTLALPALKAG
ncbi:MAG: retroviral-like aspartic protease family protein [Merdibacter sp.]